MLRKFPVHGPAKFLSFECGAELVVHDTRDWRKVKNKCNEALAALTGIIVYPIRRASPLPLSGTSFCGGLLVCARDRRKVDVQIARIL